MRFSASLPALLIASATAISAAPTFNRDVLPILQQHCQSCHRPGEIAPMPLLTYAGTRPWAKAIKAAVLSKKMPPWNGDPRYGPYANDPTLRQSDIDTIVQWVDAGAPAGDPKDKPPDIAWHRGWHIRPDVIVSMPEPIDIPATGVLNLTEIAIPNCFTKDTWITAIEIMPGNRSVVHHADLSFVPHQKDIEYGVPYDLVKERNADGVATHKVMPRDSLGNLKGWDAIYVPGNSPVDFAEYRSARLVPANTDLVLQMHYTPNGKDTTDQTRIAFTLAKEPPAKRFLTIIPTALRDANHFRIPAGNANWQTSSEVVFNEPAELAWFLPHMHLRGKDITYRLIYPSGESQTVLSVKYDFNWQFGYELAKPIAVPAGTKLVPTAHFDNSANNPLNPDPSRDVWWGDQTWEEMMIPFFGVVVDPRVDPSKVVAYPHEFAAEANK